MMRSLYSGVSGLKNHQIRMDVIGHNVSNVNTHGYKAERVNFMDLLSQELSGASEPRKYRWYKPSTGGIRFFDCLYR
jgi:flagellar hook protein FlgE